jgi:hypothetical protein
MPNCPLGTKGQPVATTPVETSARSESRRRSLVGLRRGLGLPGRGGGPGAVRDSPAADYLLQSATVDGARVTRLCHQALADELLATRPRRADEAQVRSCLRPHPNCDVGDVSSYAKTSAAQHADATGMLAPVMGGAMDPKSKPGIPVRRTSTALSSVYDVTLPSCARPTRKAKRAALS